MIFPFIHESTQCNHQSIEKESGAVKASNMFYPLSTDHCQRCEWICKIQFMTNDHHETVGARYVYDESKRDEKERKIDKFSIVWKLIFIFSVVGFYYFAREFSFSHLALLPSQFQHSGFSLIYFRRFSICCWCCVEYKQHTARKINQDFFSISSLSSRSCVQMTASYRPSGHVDKLQK